MSRPLPPRRRAARPATALIVLWGSALVIALVAALPLALAFCPADALGSDEGGIGAGTGDLLAAALSSLDHDLHGRSVVAAPRCVPAPAFAAWGAGPARDAEDRAPCCEPPPTPAPALPGRTSAGHQLLL